MIDSVPWFLGLQALIKPSFILRSIENDLRQQVQEARSKWSNFAPRLAIVQVGGREDSNVYIRMKLKAAENIGITAEHVKLPRDITETEVGRLQSHPTPIPWDQPFLFNNFFY